MGVSLGPALREVCAGHLGKIDWFRATWQHGAAATGFANWTFSGGRTVECVVKLPVNFAEYSWTKRLGLLDAAGWDSPEALSLPTPRVVAGGFELGGYDLAWLVIERLKSTPMAAEHTARSIIELFDSAAEFHEAAVTLKPVEPDRALPAPDWPELLARGMKAVRETEPSDDTRWLTALAAAAEAVDNLSARWVARPIETWCHHDLHGRNALRRVMPDQSAGRCVLIDLAMVGPGSWIEDALYLERLCWGREDLLCGVDPLESLAQARLAHGLPVEQGYEELADLRRVLMAASSPAFLATEGDSRYLRSALERLERLLPVIAV